MFRVIKDVIDTFSIYLSTVTESFPKPSSHYRTGCGVRILASHAPFNTKARFSGIQYLEACKKGIKLTCFSTSSGDYNLYPKITIWIPQKHIFCSQSFESSTSPTNCRHDKLHVDCNLTRNNYLLPKECKKSS